VAEEFRAPDPRLARRGVRGLHDEAGASVEGEIMSYKSVPLGRKRRISSTGDEGEREEDDEVAHGESFQTQRSGHVSDAAGAKAIAL
jgi:hypothetical protein